MSESKEEIKIPEGFTKIATDFINDILIKGIGNGLFIDLIMADSVSNLEQIEGYEERVKQKADNLINSIDEQLKISIDSSINVDDTATEFFSWFFGPCFTAVGYGKNIRETYEHLNPTKQCTESFKIRELFNSSSCC